MKKNKLSEAYALVTAIGDSEIYIKQDEKMDYLKLNNPLKGTYRDGELIVCLHCGSVYPINNFKIIRTKFGDDKYSDLISCKNWPICDGNLIDFFPPNDEDLKKNGIKK